MKPETYIVVCTAVIVLVAVGISGYDSPGALEIELYIKIPEIPEETRTGGIEVPVPEPEPAIRYVWPIHAEDFEDLSSPYGIRRSPFSEDLKDHTGLDAYGVWHARILSVWNGVVIDHYPPPDGYYRGDGDHGARIIIRHDDGSSASYSHLSETYVHEGMRVVAGQEIGRQGNTGKADGEHLHLELEIDGVLVNPLSYIEVPQREATPNSVM
tara:strand:+ start:246 stop:881 length:636 start_codon:yes stop_codon:yes gene_type:complete